MKLWIPVMFALIAAQQPSMVEIRRLYMSSALEKDSLVKLTAIINSANADGQPILNCYAGAAQIIAAKYTQNPLTRFSDFKKGKLMMENAIAKDSGSFEMRYLRLSIQCNLPSFLNYHAEMTADQLFLKTNLDNQSDKQLREMAEILLNTNKLKN